MEIVQFVAKATLFGLACGAGAWILALIIGVLMNADADEAAPASLALALLGFVVATLSWLAWAAP